MLKCCSHFLAESGNVPRNLSEAVATIMVGVELIAQLFEHGCVGVSYDSHLGLGSRSGTIVESLFVALPVAFEARHCVSC